MAHNLNGKIYYFMRGGLRQNAGASAMLQGQLVQFLSGGWGNNGAWGLVWQSSRPGTVPAHTAPRVSVTTVTGQKVQAVQVDFTSTQHNTFY